jgi:DNA polymerase III epsilon subunit-like protein
MTKILIFDTETTGLPKSYTINYNVLNLWPYIVQFSYIIYDCESKCLIKIKDNIIQVPKEINISDECINIHGITNELSQNQGIPVEVAIKEFMQDLKTVNLVVAHNMEFDLNLLKVEIMRKVSENLIDSEKKEPYLKYLNVLSKEMNYYCTMQNSIQLCNIKRISKKGKEYTKFPKLSELHEKLFQIIPNNLHNSLNDVLVCLRCFYKLKYDDDLIQQDTEFHSRMTKLL